QNAIQRYLTDKKLDFLSATYPLETAPETPALSLQSYKEESLGTVLEAFEKQFIAETLKNQKWKKSKTAQLLGVSRKTLFRKMKQYGLEK
ncbi:MAG TPA: helix-turn-helix domain-containing protein, partial [Syntrophales bacterium]|nr:helix-turn-helix domain-containing protein [Syntrophales bacterium]